MLFNIDLNVFTVLADFICSGIIFQIGVLSEGKVSCSSKQWVLLKSLTCLPLQEPPIMTILSLSVLQQPLSKTFCTMFLINNCTKVYRI